MTPRQIQNRAVCREQVERYLATDMTVKEWCELNHVSESTMYRWMAVFRREEPGMFADPTHRCPGLTLKLEWASSVTTRSSSSQSVGKN